MRRIILISAGLLGCALLLDSLLLEASALGGVIKIAMPLALAALDYAVLLWPAVAMAVAMWWLLRGSMAAIRLHRNVHFAQFKGVGFFVQIGSVAISIGRNGSGRGIEIFTPARWFAFRPFKAVTLRRGWALA